MTGASTTNHKLRTRDRIKMFPARAYSLAGFLAAGGSSRKAFLGFLGQNQHVISAPGIRWRTRIDHSISCSGRGSAEGVPARKLIQISSTIPMKTAESATLNVGKCRTLRQWASMKSMT